MKKKYTSLTACLLCLTVLVPFTAFANHDDDSERRTSRTSFSRYSSKIKDLDDDAVEKLPIPILLGVTLRMISPNFGDDRDGGDRTHEGLDIMAPKGAPIISPTESVVTRVGTGDNSGKTVTTANPGKESFVYMHLSEISVKAGDVLKKGDLIGYVGNTGNASGGAPHLHFEIRDEDRDATDPYDRIKVEFSLKDKIAYLKNAIESADDEDDFVEFVVETYQSELRQAKLAGIALPKEIDKEIQVAPPTVPSVVTSYESASGDLTLGSQGPLVVALQEALVAKNVGTAALELKKAGATGYFGTITLNALIEYQLANGIVPAAGYYGPKTRAFMLAN